MATYFDEINSGTRSPGGGIKVVEPAPTRSGTTSYFRPTAPAGSVTSSDIRNYHASTAVTLAQIEQEYMAQSRAANAGSGAARAAANDRLKFGLRGIGLDREELGLNRRDAVEAAINNALKRGIYNSGIRVRNVARANERADLAAKRIQLNEDELRASVKNALASLQAQASANRGAYNAAMDAAKERFEMDRRTSLDQFILEQGGRIFDDSSVSRKHYLYPGSGGIQ